MNLGDHTNMLHVLEFFLHLASERDWDISEGEQCVWLGSSLQLDVVLFF